jgi:UDP-N-acetylglucosamine--N-acetylmuramyl-(pentapeptide) pyrophosphoryl-undecaprenol N-acetylglucosamine transferase
MNVVITGGGTGGHIFAGVAIAEALQRLYPDTKLIFIGSSEGLETRLVPKAGYILKTLCLGRLVGQRFVSRLKTLLQIPIAIFTAIYYLKKFKAQAIVGVGGFAAGPCIVAGALLRIPIYVLEQNSILGFTNQIATKLARKVFTAFDVIPVGVDSTKCMYTGNPSRTTMVPIEKTKHSKFNIFAFGGSQGATGINKLLTEACQILAAKGYSLEICHQTGPNDFDWVKKYYKSNGIEAMVFSFIDDMQKRYADADLVVCRAGAGTISELAATQNAAIFIPFPFAAQNHQEKNARVVESKGAAIVLSQRTTTSALLADEIEQLIKNPTTLATMRLNMKQFHTPSAAEIIARTVRGAT